MRGHVTNISNMISCLAHAIERLRQSPNTSAGSTFNRAQDSKNTVLARLEPLGGVSSAFTFGCGAALLIPFFIWELGARPVMQLTTNNLLSLFYVAVFPSTLAYLCFNRGVQLIGANRAAPFFHMVPVFGTIMSIVFIGEHPQAFHFIGFALVLAGVFAASRKQSAA